MKPQDRSATRPSQIADKVADIAQMFGYSMNFSLEEMETQRQKRLDKAKELFPYARDLVQAEELLMAADLEFEQNILKALLGSIDPNKIWSIENRDDVLSGFLPGPLIGHGGTSDIYLCWTRFNRHTMVIKLIRYADAKVRVDKMLALRELQTILKFNHPNIVKVFDAGYVKVIEDGKPEVYPYLAMERLTGQTLEKWIRQHRPGDNASRIAKREWLKTVAKACVILAETLSQCHEQEIAHGDMKPNNIHVCGTSPTKETLKIYDFGFSADVDGHIHGETLGYNHPADTGRDWVAMISRDIFGLGMTLLFCVTGKAPPLTSDPSQYETELRADIRQVDNSDLRLIIQMTTDRDQTKRYSSVKQVEEDLAAWHGNRPLPHARKGDYTWWEKERMLWQRARDKNELDDQMQIVGRTFLGLSILATGNAVGYLLLVWLGFSNENADDYSNLPTLGLSLMLFVSVAVWTWGKINSVKILEPLIAGVISFWLLLFVVVPSEYLGSPNWKQRNTAGLAALVIIAVLNISYGTISREWKAIRPVAWGILASTFFLRPLFESQYSLFAMPVVIAVVEVIVCLTYARVLWFGTGHALDVKQRDT